MFEIVYRYDPKNPPEREVPADAEAARLRLEEGNREFVSLLDLAADPTRSSSTVIPLDVRAFGVFEPPGTAPKQSPFAAVLACSDARVPTELIFKQSYNDLFVSRVAGNVLGAECLGSLEYAAAHLADSLRLIVVLGHSSCGAVTAAVDSFLEPSDYPTIAPTLALRSIVNGVIVAVRAAAKALATSVDGDVTQCEGYRQALIETSAVLNSAMTALTIERELNKLPTGGLEAVYGVYDLVSRRVRVPTGSRTEGKPDVGLARPPKNAEAFDELSDQVVRGSFVRGLLGMD